MPQISLYLLLALGLLGSVPYKLPPKDVVDILDAAPLPRVSMSPDREKMLLIELEKMPAIADLAMPMLRIAGIRITPQYNSRQVLGFSTGLVFGDGRRVVLPAGVKFTGGSWSNDGSRFLFSRYVDGGVELWVVNAATAQARALTPPRLNLVLGQPMWMPDGKEILVSVIPQKRVAAPAEPPVSDGPVVQESGGRQAMVATYEDLLKSPFDEKLFEYYSTSQLALVDAATGAVRNVGFPGIYLEVEPSPDGRYILVTRLRQPFSYSVPYYDFACSYEIWDVSGKLVKTIAESPAAEDVPLNGVRIGPRDFAWQARKPAALVWAEALDGGDPERAVPHRDRIMSLAAPFAAEPREVLKMEHRFRGLTWFESPGLAFSTEFDWKRNWRTTWLVNIDDALYKPKKVFDLSINDQYNAPGYPVLTPLGPDWVVLEDSGWIYLRGEGASPQGDHPFLDRMNLATGEKQRLFRCADRMYESFVAFQGKSREKVIITRESRTEVPNYYVYDLKSHDAQPLTRFKDPAPQLTAVKRQLVRYKRDDGVDLSGTLYLPADYKEGTRLPVVIWAYPLEYNDAGTAGQVRGSAERFTFYRGASQLLFVTQGYAVFDNATMPVIGDPKTMNDTYVQQIVANAKAAIDVLDRMGVADRRRVGVGGHSYGAFMTANLLAHCDLFAAGIARSGAYNRTLTPFGFQSERRTLWEARDTYINMSPFMHADKIKTPLLLIHGMADNNSGTFPIQSERLFAALKGFGATARFVYLPFESHGYSARESNLTVLAEMFAWFDKYVKGSDHDK
jgi:dipeptidyl aminopeptidase/acylaminoacyl peptidase